jgi:peptidyl-prolyl cis-trans isomerase C
MRRFLFTAVACAVAVAQAADPAPAPAKPAAPPAPKAATAVSVAVPDAASIEAVLSAIPDIVAKYGDNKTVSGVEIKGKLRSGITMYAQKMGRLPGSNEVLNGTRQIAESMITQELLLAKLEADGIKIDPADGQKMLAELEAKNGKEQIEKGMQAQGLTRDELLKQLAFSMAVDKWVMAKIKPQVKVSDDAVAAFYKEKNQEFQKPEEVRASHILVKVDAGADAAAKAAAKAKAEEILKQLKGGADFAALAKEKSDCPSKSQGGDLGAFARGSMVPEFETAAFGLKPGEMSGVVETKFGYHVIKCVEHRQAETTPLDDTLKGQIRTVLERQEIEKAFRAARTDLREKGKIQMFLPEPPPRPAAAAMPAAAVPTPPPPAAK